MAGSDTEAADWPILQSAGNRESTFVRGDQNPWKARRTYEFTDREEALHRQGAIGFDEDRPGDGGFILR